ncbi:flagellar biosynthesis protein FlhF [Cytobacillus kochii]|uniref:flagellar biosynthesis protein FlhF n=1 Tax=Cytobacillus kochii TaxID=859143 RepID=UPI002E1C104B|nr:flagellar biosynthesis protein FlhF [Cytobacillus kochii]MED1606505.1 flagellar biosynthesis protein FlhF [Cytobacillus kochii]
MKVKKFTVNTMAEGLEKIRKDLGPDAMILQTKKTKKATGFLGLFKKEQLEIMAGVDPEAKQQKSDQPPAFQTQTSSSELENMQQIITQLNEVKGLMKEKRNNLHRQTETVPTDVKTMIERLHNMELPAFLINEMTDHLLSRWYKESEQLRDSKVTEWIEEYLTSKLEGISFGGITFNNKLIKLVGPTGVGKTTTIAKLAAEAVLKHKKQVAFITTDTYRIAAIEQLKTYADIFHAPLEVCYSAEDYQQAVEKFAHYDVIFIDTAGRNYRLEENIKELSSVTKATDFPTETFLVLSLTAKVEDMKEIYEQFTRMDIDRFLFTKIDETSNLNAVGEMVLRFQKGIAYMTNGQEVPEDLKEMTKEKFLNIVLKKDSAYV